MHTLPLSGSKAVHAVLIAREVLSLWIEVEQHTIQCSPCCIIPTVLASVGSLHHSCGRSSVGVTCACRDHFQNCPLVRMCTAMLIHCGYGKSTIGFISDGFTVCTCRTLLTLLLIAHISVSLVMPLKGWPMCITATSPFLSRGDTSPGMKLTHG